MAPLAALTTFTTFTTFTALAAFSPAAQAVEFPGCAGSAVGSAPAVAERPAAALQRMLALLPVCSKDALFLSTLGQLLNSQGRYLEAADHLEHALMLEPDLKDAQLSYAIALTGSGDIASARALVDNLLADAALPADLRPLIERQKALLANGNGNGVSDPSGWEKRFTLSTRIGYDTNLLGSPNITSLPLTLAGQTIILQLDGNYLARPAGYLRADAQLELGRIASDGARWDAVVSLRSRYSPVLAAAGSTQADMLVERSHFTPNQGEPAAPGNEANKGSSGNFFSASASMLNSNAGTRFVAAGVATGWGTSWGSTAASTCQARAGLELQERKYLDNEVLSGRYTGFSLNWSCENLQGARLLLGLRAGRDMAANASRPGAHQQQSSVRVGAFLPQAHLTPAGSAASGGSTAGVLRNGLSLDLEHSQQQDSNAYSPIIDSGRSRKMLRTTLRAEYQYTFSRSVQGVFGAEWVGQSSNIQLFRLSSQGVYSGLRVGW